MYVCVFFYPINYVSPGAILLVQFWEVGVYRFLLGEEVDMMQEKFLPATGVGEGAEPGEQTLGLAARGQDQTSILATQVGDNPEEKSHHGVPELCNIFPLDTVSRRNGKKGEKQL